VIGKLLGNLVLVFLMFCVSVIRKDQSVSGEPSPVSWATGEPHLSADCTWRAEIMVQARIRAVVLYCSISSVTNLSKSPTKISLSDKPTQQLRYI
jgi:hypothetical protein